MRKGKNIKILMVGVALMTVALFAWSMRENIFYKMNKPVKAVKRIGPGPVTKQPVYDTVLIKKFSDISRSFNVQNTRITYSGIINVEDGADSTKNIRNMGFLYSRNGNDFYCKNGDTETLNADGIYLYVEHDHKRVLISKQREIAQAPLPDMSKIDEKLKTEHYELTDTKNGAYETIALLNEHNITCKEYAITFDTLRHVLSNVRMRLTCIYDPLNKKKDKLITMKVGLYEGSANVHGFIDKDKIVFRDNEDWKLTAQYKNYELIKVP